MAPLWLVGMEVMELAGLGPLAPAAESHLRGPPGVQGTGWGR